MALGHHRFYDGSGGYPLAYDRAAQPNQPVVDIVAVASFFLSSTDRISPLNHQVLSLDEAFQAVSRLAGTRFSPDAAALLLELAPEIRAGLDLAIRQAYEEAFRRTI